MRFVLIGIFIVTAVQAFAETVIATRTIRPQEIVTAQDVRLDGKQIEGAHSNLGDVIGLEVRKALYPGRPIMRGHVGIPAVVDRNQLVEIVFDHGGLRITAEGRALGRGGIGERIRVMNVASRNVLFGTISENGSIEVKR